MTQSAQDSTPPAPGQTILVVDDDTDIRETVQNILEEDGFKVATARNGAEALEYLRTAERPAFVLLDLTMPVMDGPTFCAELQNDAELSALPVIAFSAAAGLADKAKSMNVAGYLRKPLRLEDLLSTASRLCERPSRAPQLHSRL